MAAGLSPVRDWQLAGAVHRDTAGDFFGRFQLSDAGGQFFVDVVVRIGAQREPGRGGGLIGDSVMAVATVRKSDWAAALTAPGVWTKRRSLPTGPVCG